ncbi:helix-turn-helix transcriptional regulator [Nocardiopsis sp. FR26]|uniref:helix-turn-helix domain-containing protein n=1 Tax=Nocardiopsis sp. FR26 TaxID=2605987 RepID=UPI0013586722|nr:helix-turn-helix transcriptional regulator [Nocardiopsis sp. FR26]
MTTHGQPPERARLRELMEARQEQLGLSWGEVAKAGGVKMNTLYRVRAGVATIQQTTKRAIEDGLQWDEGSVDAILGGGDPTPLEADSPQVTARPGGQGGSQVWITMPGGGSPVMVPLVWSQIPGLENADSRERAVLTEEMVGRMVHAGWEFLYEEGRKRLKGHLVT